MLNLKHASNYNSRKQSGTRASNQFKIVVIGLPNAGTTHLISQLLNTQFTQQTKRFKVYHCSINTTTLVWSVTDRSYQPPASNKSCIRAVIFEVIATKAILDLLYLLIAPEDIIVLVYDPSLLSTVSYMADIDYILNFVSAHCNTQCCSSTTQSSHFPAVLMMGICTSVKLYSQAINFFRKYYRGKACEKHIFAFHFISGYKGVFPESELCFLKESISTAAGPLYSQHCPSKYLQFEQAIFELHGHRSFLTTLKASAIADQIGIQATEQLFKYFRNKGIILYYPKVQDLQDKIFISPQLIIPITAIFEPRDHLSLQESFMGFSLRLQRWLAYLLVNFNLAVSGHWLFSKASKAGFYHDDTAYIIPSLIHNKVVPKKLKPEDYVGVLYYFPDKFLPRCVFYQLMTKLIDWFHADENSINYIDIDKEYFILESKDLCELIVQFSNELIKCYIKIPPTERAIKESLYPSLFNFIQKAVVEICNFCLPSAQKPVCHLECPFDHEDSKELPHLPFNEINNKSSVICNIMNIPISRKCYECLFESNCELCS